jgi:hypothetical protein
MFSMYKDALFWIFTHAGSFNQRLDVLAYNNMKI